MDYLQKFVTQFRERLLALLIINNLFILADWWLADQIFKLAGLPLIIALLFAPLLSFTVLPWAATRYLTQPTKLLWQGILHIVPDSRNVPAPKLDSTRFGRELVKHLTSNVYQLAIDGAQLAEKIDQEAYNLHRNEIATKLPLPLLVLDAKAAVSFANAAALHYLETSEVEVTGKNFYTLLDLAFSSEDTLDSWLKSVQDNTVTAASSWQRVRINLPSGKTAQFDLAASYSKADPLGHEVLLTMFDRTATYEQDDNNLSFIAIVMHELRTPLSLLLGYIELFEEELGDSLNPELTKFMHRMKTAGQNLAVFVSNVLTVARIESNQLELRLAEEDWSVIISQAVDNMRLRAKVRGISLELEQAADVPSVGVNITGASEVITNLIDNAIKYSQDAADKRVIIRTSMDKAGLVETTVQDFGAGIPASVVPNLFEKFYRNHLGHTQISGTGLGLYLCRLIIEAHGGNIWVRSHEGRGTTFGFTVQPYALLASTLKSDDNDSSDIVHSAHGWVKNHSLYRR